MTEVPLKPLKPGYKPGESPQIVGDRPVFSVLALDGFRFCGISYRSWQAPETLVSVEPHVIPLTARLFELTGVLAPAVLTA